MSMETELIRALSAASMLACGKSIPSPNINGNESYYSALIAKLNTAAEGWKHNEIFDNGAVTGQKLAVRSGQISP